MPHLLPLVFDAAPTASQTPSGRNGGLAETVPCAFCGVRSGQWQRRARADGAPACPLCTLTLHLERPQIDQEAALAWLPEISQPAVNTLFRELHLALWAMREDVRYDARPRRDSPERRVLFNTAAILHQRTEAAGTRLGSSLPSDLASALVRLSPQAHAERAALLGGLRLLPLGRFHDGERDVYPDILETWQRLARANPDAPSPSGAR